MKNPYSKQWKQISALGLLLIGIGFLLPGAGMAETVSFQQNISFVSTTDSSQSNRYALFTPANLQPDTKYPLVVFLHGSGNRGTNTTAASLREAAQIWARATNQLVHPAFVIAPVVPTNQLWADNTTNGVENFANTPYTMKLNPTPNLRMMVELVQSLEQTLPIDRTRIYLVGESMGGYGAWEAAVRYPAIWAAVIPLMGGTDPSKAAIIKDLPIWTFHAADDPTVPVTGTRQMVSALQSAGGHPLYTEFATGGHGISTEAVNYPAQSGNPSLLDWTYQQVKVNLLTNADGIIYSNDFSGGHVDIDGTAPTYINPNAGLFGGSSGALFNVVTNNSAAGYAAYQDGTLGPKLNSVLLPFMAQAGHIYTLSASLIFTVTPPAGGWGGLGFSTQFSTNYVTDPRVLDNWALLNMGANGGGAELFANRTLIGNTPNLMAALNTPYAIKLVLDTTDAHWSIAFYVDNTLVKSYAYTNNPSIVSFGYTQTTTTGGAFEWGNLTLSTALLPVITQQPVSQAVAEGDAYTNTVTAITDDTGGLLFYQWYENNASIANATNASLIINPVSLSDAGTNYYVIVTNDFGAVTSAVVSLTVVTNAITNGAVQLTSPDGSLVLTFAITNFDGSMNCPVYSLTRNGQMLITTSKLGLTFDGDGLLQNNLAILNDTISSNNSTWQPVYAEKSSITNNYNQLDVNLQELVSPYRLLQLTFRVYNEGAAFRYIIPTQTGLDGVTNLTEQSEFRFDSDYTTWATYTAQGIYAKTTISGVTSGCERPLPVELATNSYVALGEAGLVNFSRMKFAPLSGKSYSLVSLLDAPVTNSLPLTTPWRFIMAADSPGQLLENDFFVLNLNDPCALTNTSWIKPGKAMRVMSETTQGGMACVDFAAKHNIQYVEFDAGWYGKETTTLVATNVVSGLNLPAVISYGASKNVGVILYVNWLAMTNELSLLPPLYKSWGVKGIKYGFVGNNTYSGYQFCVDDVNAAARICATNQMMLEAHDEFRPSGYTRTYPNFMTMEGVLGDEGTPTTTQDTTELFSRLLVGGADHTVCYFEKRVTNSWNFTYQLAKSVCFYSPWQYIYWYDYPTNSPNYVPGGNQGITDVPEMEFWDYLPTVWDETKVLQASIGQYAIIARRSGTQWFIGAMNANSNRTFNIPLNFLTPGQKYIENVYSQDPSVQTRTHVRIDRFVVDSTATLTMNLAPTSGKAIRLLPANPPAIQSLSKLPGGGVGLTMNGTVSLPYSIWSSPNLSTPVTNWTLLNSGLITNSPFPLNDSLAQTQCFYRSSTP